MSDRPENMKVASNIIMLDQWSIRRYQSAWINSNLEEDAEMSIFFLYALKYFIALICSTWKRSQYLPFFSLARWMGKKSCSDLLQFQFLPLASLRNFPNLSLPVSSVFEIRVWLDNARRQYHWCHYRPNCCSPLKVTDLLRTPAGDRGVDKKRTVTRHSCSLL